MNNRRPAIEARAIWYPYYGGELLVRWFFEEEFLSPFLQTGTVPTLCDIFDYALLDWRNIRDGNDKPLMLTKAVKEAVFRENLGGIAEFVLAIVRDSNKRFAAAVAPLIARTLWRDHVSRN